MSQTSLECQGWLYLAVHALDPQVRGGRGLHHARPCVHLRLLQLLQDALV